jgi:hypothetical protein
MAGPTNPPSLPIGSVVAMPAVAAEIGLAIIPHWASRLAVPGARYVPLEVRGAERLDLLPLAAAWVRGSRDPVRDALMAMLRSHLRRERQNPSVDMHELPPTVVGALQSASSFHDRNVIGDLSGR